MILTTQGTPRLLLVELLLRLLLVQDHLVLGTLTSPVMLAQRGLLKTTELLTLALLEQLSSLLLHRRKTAKSSA